MDKSELADALDLLAAAVEQDATTIIGSQASVEVRGPFRGTVTGDSVSVTVGPGASGNVIGRRTSVVVTGVPSVPPEVAELRQIAARLRADGDAPKGLRGLVARVKDMGGRIATDLAAAILVKLATGG